MASVAGGPDALYDALPAAEQRLRRLNCTLALLHGYEHELVVSAAELPAAEFERCRARLAGWRAMCAALFDERSLDDCRRVGELFGRRGDEYADWLGVPVSEILQIGSLCGQETEEPASGPESGPQGPERAMMGFLGHPDASCEDQAC